MSNVSTITAVGSDVALKLRVRQLIVVHSPTPASRPRVLLGSDPVTIGREGGDATFPLADAEASRLHARVTRDPASEAWWLEDSGSRNGTFVGGRRVARVLLEDGAVIRVGRTVMLYLEALTAGGDDAYRVENRRLLGNSVAMQRLRAEIDQVAAQRIPVLILGETGVGKELVAEELHARSGRSGRFVAVNCAAIPEHLAESELFGHVAGAFTGATQKKEGLFAAADGGTLFLDEVGEMSAVLQPKLLRALATGEVRPVGASEPRRVDVRIVAATLRDLSADTREDRFRADLLARLAGWTLRVPPLRARRDDIVRLATAFLGRYAGSPTLSTDAAEALLLHDWPLNVRELQQVITAAAIRRAGSDAVRCDHLPDELAARLVARSAAATIATPPVAAPLAVTVAREMPPTADQLRQLLEHERGNVARVAAFYGKERRQIYRWAKQLGIDVATFRHPAKP